MPIRPRRLSLGARLALIVFAVQAGLLAVLTITIYGAARDVMLDAFDESLRSKAEALASLVEEDGEEWEVELGAEDFEGRFSRKTDPELFAVFKDEETPVTASPALAEVPAFVHGNTRRTAFFADAHNGRRYRAVVLSTRARADEHSGEEPSFENESDEEESHEVRTLQPVVVYYSASIETLYARLHSFGLMAALLCFLCVVVSGFLAHAVARLGLLPLLQLAARIGAIREDQLGARLPADNLRPELLPIAESVNALLARVEQAMETERRFSADAAHELRTPIATLKSGVQAALLSPSTDEARGVYEALLADIERLEGLCDALLLLAAGQTESRATLSPADWIGEIEAALAALRSGAEAKRATINADASAQCPAGMLVRADTQAAWRIAANLIGNALQHGGDGVTVSVRMEFDDTTARLIVEDDGPGVPPGKTGGLFQRFFRADDSRTRPNGGDASDARPNGAYGLGLSICRTLARAHDGDVSHQANTPRGCRFVWSAPLIPSASTPDR